MGHKFNYIQSLIKPYNLPQIEANTDVNYETYANP